MSGWIIHCECGCGESFEQAPGRGRPRRFVPGHRTRSNREFILGLTGPRQERERPTDGGAAVGQGEKEKQEVKKQTKVIHGCPTDVKILSDKTLHERLKAVEHELGLCEPCKAGQHPAGIDSGRSVIWDHDLNDLIKEIVPHIEAVNRLIKELGLKVVLPTDPAPKSP